MFLIAEKKPSHLFSSVIFLVLDARSPSKKSPQKAIFLAQSKIFHNLCNRFGKVLPITTYFNIAL